MIKYLVLFMVLAAGCDSCKVKPPSVDECIEFDHFTTHKGRRSICRMVWCEENDWSSNGSVSSTGGLSTLWCDDSDSDLGVK